MLRSIVKPIQPRADIGAEAGANAEPPSAPARETLGRLFTYLRPYRTRFIITICIYLTCITVAQFYPFIRPYPDRPAHCREKDGWVSARFWLIAVVAHLLNQFGVMIRSLIMSRISLSILTDLRRELMAHVSHLSFKFHETEPVGKTMTRFIGDANTLNDFLTSPDGATGQRHHVWSWW